MNVCIRVLREAGACGGDVVAVIEATPFSGADQIDMTRSWLP
jgi:hypothetical protein